MQADPPDSTWIARPESSRSSWLWAKISGERPAKASPIAGEIKLVPDAPSMNGTVTAPPKKPTCIKCMTSKAG